VTPLTVRMSSGVPVASVKVRIALHANGKDSAVQETWTFDYEDGQWKFDGGT